MESCHRLRCGNQCTNSLLKSTSGSSACRPQCPLGIFSCEPTVGVALERRGAHYLQVISFFGEEVFL